MNNISRLFADVNFHLDCLKYLGVWDGVNFIPNLYISWSFNGLWIPLILINYGKLWWTVIFSDLRSLECISTSCCSNVQLGNFDRLIQLLYQVNFVWYMTHIVCQIFFKQYMISERYVRRKLIFMAAVFSVDRPGWRFPPSLVIRSS